MALLRKILILLPAIVAVPAAYSAIAPANNSAWFEPSDSGNDHWSVRTPAVEAELSARSVKLRGLSGSLLDLHLAGASERSRLDGEEPLPAHSSYFRGANPNRWRSGVTHFKRVRATGVYPGIDAIYYQGAGGLEVDFVVSPGADESRIRLEFPSRNLALDAGGSLRDKQSGEILMAAPTAWEVNQQGNREIMRGGLRLDGPHSVAFRFHRENRNRTLVIDPILSFATYFGGTGRDTITAVERGPDGRICIAGSTTSVDLPLGVSLNSPLIRPISLPVEDTFVACYSADGSTLLYVVYVGGDADDVATSMAVDAQGRATVAGYSQSLDFPTTARAFSSGTSSRDAFAYRISADGSTLEYSTFLKVISPNWGYLAINPITFLVAVDANGAATIGGTAVTFTPNPGVPEIVIGIPPTPGVFQAATAGGNDVFLMRLSPDGTAVTWATYYGGTQNETLAGMALDPAGDVVITGMTTSNDLPLVAPLQGVPLFPAKASFFAKLTADGKTLQAASYLGGQSTNYGNTVLNSVAIDNAGAIYLAGSSPVSAVPGLTDVPPGPPTSYAPAYPAFLLKLDPTATVKQYLWAYSFLTAGSVGRVRVDGSGQPCLMTSFGAAPATTGALPANNGYPGYGFACFAGDGKTLRFATMAPGGGTGPSPTPADFALSPDGTIAGASNVANGMIVTANAPQTAPAGSWNAYVFEIAPQNPSPNLYYVNPPIIFGPLAGNSAASGVTLLGSNFALGDIVLLNGSAGSVANTTVSSTALGATFSAAIMAALPKGDVQLQVSMPAPGGGVSSPFKIKYLNPAPGTVLVTPQTVPVGSGATTFTVIGGLTSDCSITWNGAPQTVTAAGGSIFHFTLPASAFSTAGDFVVVASNPAPGGGSATAHVSVTASGLPAPSVVGPVVVGIGQGGATQTLTVNVAPDDAVVVWNGSDRPTSRLNSTTLQFILSQNDLQQMGSAQLQIRSGGVLGSAVTAYVGLPMANQYVRGDSSRGVAFLATKGSAGISALAAVSVPSGTVLRSLDLGAIIESFFMTDDNAWLWVTTSNGRITRVNADTFATDLTITVPGVQSSSSILPAAIAVPGTSSTIVASGADGILRIFDNGVQRGFSSADLFPAAPSLLTPVFATPTAVWATVGSYASNCMVRLTDDYTGFSGFAQTCNGQRGPWGLPSPEVKVDAGVTYFESDPETLVWNSPRGGYVDLVNRVITTGTLNQLAPQSGLSAPIYGSRLTIFDMDSESQTGTVPVNGWLPTGNFVAYTGTQALYSTQSMLLLVDLPSETADQRNGHNYGIRGPRDGLDALHGEPLQPNDHRMNRP